MQGSYDLRAPGGKEVFIIFGSFTLSLKIVNQIRNRQSLNHAFDCLGEPLAIGFLRQIISFLVAFLPHKTNFLVGFLRLIHAI